MTRVRDLHQQAMALADEADGLRRQDDAQWRKRMGEGAELEAEAASLTTEEPSRSVLYRSAATMMLDAGRVCEAKLLVSMGLVGDGVPDAIGEELRVVRAKAALIADLANASQSGRR